jgi:preprotein translocase subunit SecE
MAKSATATREDKEGAQPGKSVEKASNKAISKAANKASSSTGTAISIGDNPVTGIFTRSIAFLKDVRSEMRKVVTPSWEEVRSMTTVVIVTVFAFAAFFYVVDGILGRVVRALLHFLGGTQ